jgi:hypothetical protein
MGVGEEPVNFPTQFFMREVARLKSGIGIRHLWRGVEDPISSLLPPGLFALWSSTPVLRNPIMIGEEGHNKIFASPLHLGFEPSAVQAGCRPK